MNPFVAIAAALGNLPSFRRLSRKPLPEREFRRQNPRRGLAFVPGWRCGAGAGEPLLRELGAAWDADLLDWAPFTAQPRGLKPKVDALTLRWSEPPFTELEEFVVVGHSFGGLIAAATLLQLVQSGGFATDRKPRLITINSPFEGPRWGLINAGRALGLVLNGSLDDPELNDMRPSNSPLKDLRGALASAPFSVTSVASRDDEFVSRTSARLSGSHLQDRAWIGHTGPLVRIDQRAHLVARLADQLRNEEA